MLRLLSICVLALSSLIAGCGGTPGTKDYIYSHGDTAGNKAQLRQLLGEPDEISRSHGAGIPAELWTYRAKDGSVTFTIVGGRVTMKTKD